MRIKSAPASANAIEQALPIPFPAPVTKATLFLRFIFLNTCISYAKILKNMTITYLKKASKTPSTDDDKTRQSVQEILKDLEKKREQGILEISKKFDKYEGEVVVSKEKVEEAGKKLIKKQRMIFSLPTSE